MPPITESSEITESESNLSSSVPKKVNPAASFHGCTGFLSSIQIEPLCFLFAMGDSILTMMVQTYYIDRICLVTKEYDPFVCQNLTQHSVEEKEVEKDVSELSMYQTLIQSGFPLIMTLFLAGPLTDKYGYKPLMLYSLCGYILYIITMISCYFIPLLPPTYLLLASVPIALSGGYVTLMIGIYGYMTSQTNIDNRSYRLAIVTATWDIGTVFGYVFGSAIFQRGGFLAIFLYIFVSYTLSFIYAFTCIKERKPEELLGSSSTDGRGESSCVSCIFNSIKEILQTTFKSRPCHRRQSILLIAAAVNLTFLAYSSKFSQYLFVRNKFGWDADKYSQFSAINTCLSGLGGLILISLFMKLLQFRDVNILLINGISNLSAYSIFATAQNEWQMFLGSGVQMFGTITTSIFKSMLSKCAHKDEYGKLLSFVICTELSMPFISGPMYNFIYVQTVISLPGAIFWVAAGFTAIVVGLCGVLHILSANVEEYSFVIDDDDDESIR